MFVIAKDPVWKAADYSWLAQANWLVVPAATGIGALAYCLRRLLSRDQKACPLALLAQGLFLFLAMEVILGEIAGQIVLQYDYYACYLLPVASIALAVHFLRVPAEVSNRWYYLLVGAVVWTFAYVLKTDAIQLQFSGREAVCRVLLSVLAAALIVAAFVPYRVWSVAAMALLLTAVNATFYPCYFTKQSARPTYMRMTKSIDLIGQFCEDRAGRVRVWYDRQEPASWEYMSIASAYFYGYCLINERFPSLDAEFPVQITAGEPLVILSNKADAGVMADKALREKSLTSRTISVREIGTGAEAYSLMFGVVEPLLTAAGAHVSSR